MAVIVLLALACLFLYFSRRTGSEPKEFKTTDKYVQQLAEEAVRDASENHVTLDYSPESIKSVDQILGKVHEQYVKDHSSIAIQGLASAYGAYIGEVIRRSEPNVHWERDDPHFGEKIYPLIWNTGNVYPMAWCEKQIENGEDDKVWMKYKVFKQLETKPSK